MVRNIALVVLTLALLRQAGRANELEKRIEALEVALGRNHFVPEPMTCMNQ